MLTVEYGNYQTPDRMAKKLSAIPLPELAGKRVLDVGTDYGMWAFLACERGASDVLGLDRNRKVNGTFVDLIANNRARAQQMRWSSCRFERIDLGREWYQFGEFDVVFCFSMYHHAYESAGGDHSSVWYWLRNHVTNGGVLLWEGPIGNIDPVVFRNVAAEYHDGYREDLLFGAAMQYFNVEHVGPAIHSRTREVYRCRPRPMPTMEFRATVRSGSGVAKTIFEFAGGRRIHEIERALGCAPLPGSLNLVTNSPFHWNARYYRAQVSDVPRSSGWRQAEWFPRWARFYPVRIEGVVAPVYAFRFEGERYPDNFVELISPVRLRDYITGDSVTVTSC